ncbi:hypothetical protein GCM10023188_35840 [Pontibacter saemangeumensis]|uniref:Uncharacterized protein n=1 Tax=Pontibacter saemangeumensis TaxID=1084525 RepID=A0ABP8LXH7_9BACT
MKLTPVAIGMINEKLFVDSALKNASAERMIKRKAKIKGRLSISFSHSLRDSRLLPFSCHLINAAPETLKAA